MFLYCVYFWLGLELYNTVKAASAFTCKAAMVQKGRILILGDQGVNRSAAVFYLIT